MQTKAEANKRSDPKIQRIGELVAEVGDRISLRDFLDAADGKAWAVAQFNSELGSEVFKDELIALLEGVRL